MNQKTVFLIVVIAAIGVVGLTTAILSASTPAHANKNTECQNTAEQLPCNGCDVNSRGFVNSEHKCQHLG